MVGILLLTDRDWYAYGYLPIATAAFVPVLADCPTILTPGRQENGGSSARDPVGAFPAWADAAIPSDRPLDGGDTLMSEQINSLSSAILCSGGCGLGCQATTPLVDQTAQPAGATFSLRATLVGQPDLIGEYLN
jgi:hypothetical protein